MGCISLLWFTFTHTGLPGTKRGRRAGRAERLGRSVLEFISIMAVLVQLVVGATWLVWFALGSRLFGAQFKGPPNQQRARAPH